MTAFVIDTTGVCAPCFAIIGEGSHTAKTISHVGILNSAEDIVKGLPVSVFHMANPIDRLELPGTMNAHTIGWIHDLDAERHTCIEEWLSTLITSTITIKYLALPASDIVCDKVSGRPIGRAFSCAGFVQCCFEEAIGIRLIAQDSLPEVDRNILLRIWSEQQINIGRRYGLQGPGPWKIFLPSYLFHALIRGNEAFPYTQPQPDPCFPANS